MLAPTPRPRRASLTATLRGGAGPNMEVLTARRRVDGAMTVARLACDDGVGGVRGSMPDEKSCGGGPDSNFDFRKCVSTVLCACMRVADARTGAPSSATASPRHSPSSSSPRP
jgi:hypothetical protein